MTAAAEPGFVHLNRDDVWRDFTLRGLDVVSGRLRLAGLPSVTGPAPTTPAAATAAAPPASPSGLAVDGDGTIYFTDSATDAIARLDACDGAQLPLVCLGGAGEEPTQLHAPGGLLVHPGRAALLVADTGNHRVQLFELHTYQLLDVWGEPGFGLPPMPGADPGRFDRPCDLDVDPAGRVYVVDRGNRRVQQFSPAGEAVATFAERVSVEADLEDPVGVAVATDQDGTVIYVLDRGRRKLLVLDPSGHLLAEHDLDVVGDPLGLAVTPDSVYVGEGGAGGAVVRLRRDGSRVGVAAGYSGPVAALALDGRGGLIVHPGGSGPPVRLALDTSFVRRGIAWGGPFGGFSGLPKNWQRVVTSMAALPSDAHVQLFVHTTDAPASEPTVEESGEHPFPSPTWSPGPPDLGEFLVHRRAGRLAWLGIELSGGGSSSASVEQVRLEFDRPGYVPDLPAIYHAEPPTAFLPRYLALAESLFGEVEDQVATLSRLADPAAAPEPFLTELARWLAVDAAADWDTAQLRDAVAAAYPESARRGTVAGLRQALRRTTGVDAWIEEPITAASWWALAEGETSPEAEREISVLGVTTMLAAAEPQGAVLGSTATVDRSHLIENAEYGMPLFDAVAHRFAVRLYQGANYSAERVAAVEALLERERPAHTEYRICLVDPGIAIGVGGRVGIDTVIGGDPPPARLDEQALLGDGFLLGGTPPGRIGQPGGIGVTTRLGSASVQDE